MPIPIATVIKVVIDATIHTCYSLVNKGLVMPITDIRQALEFIRKTGQTRDRKFAKLLRQGWKLARLADYFHISRQRAQQIAQRLRKPNGPSKPDKR